MIAEIIPFPTPARAQPSDDPHPHPPYIFWFELLGDMSPNRRRATIVRAHECGAIDDEDAEIFLTSWLDLEGA